MPAVDDARRRLMLAPRHVRALVELTTGAPADPAAPDLGDPGSPGALTELRQAGLVLAGDQVAPLVQDLLTCMAVPVLRVSVEVLGPQGATLADVVVSGEDVWISEPWPGGEPDREQIHSRHDLPTLMWDLTRMVALRRSVPPAGARPVTADLVTVERLLTALSADPPPDWDAFKAWALSRVGEDLAHLPEPDRTQWIAVMASLQSSWRLTAFWGDPETEEGVVRALAVLDCGPEGYWRRTQPVEPLGPEALQPDTPVRYEPVTAGELWTAVARTLPRTEELRRAATARESAGTP